MSSIFKVVLFLVYFTCFVRTWDLAVTADGHIEFFHRNGSTDMIHGHQFTHLTALAYDSIFQSLYFTDTQNDNFTVFEMNNTGGIISLVKKRIGDNVQGLAYDPVSGILFWTDANNRSIFWVSLLGEFGVGKVLIEMSEETPQGIAVDSCRRFLYWTNSNYQNPTIERSRLDGSDREILIKDDLFMPLGITVDQLGARLYWTDDKEGIYYRIESSDLNGKDRQILYHGINQQPYTIAVAAGTIYWTDWIYKAVWSLPLNPSNDTEPTIIISFKSAPIGIIAKDDILAEIGNSSECVILQEAFRNKTKMIEEQQLLKSEQEKNSLIVRMETLTENYKFCLNGGIMNVKSENFICICPIGFSGARCETSVCYNYCIEGSCVTNNEGSPLCRCYPNYGGERCQHNLCDGYCLNSGKCLVKNRVPQCQCPNNVSGKRCENFKKSEGCDNCSVPINYEEPISNASGILNKTAEVNVNHEDFVSSIDLDSGCINGQMRDPIMMALAALCIVLSSVCAYLAHKVMELKKRPRIKKRIIVNKNVTPLTSRPEPRTQCEITIENCCNMNICETPCFEPEGIRTTLPVDKNKKEEKKNLLNNMEHPEDLY